MREYSKSTQTSIIRRPKRYIDNDTGEVIEAEQIIKQVYDQKQFWKLYLMDFMKVLDLFESKQLDVLIYILEHTHPSTNMFIGTFKKIADECKVSMETVRKSMDKLKKAGFLIKLQNGVYGISPDFMFKGNDNKKRLILEYHDMTRNNNNDFPGSAGDDDLDDLPDDIDDFPGSAGDDDLDDFPDDVDDFPGSAGDDDDNAPAPPGADQKDKE